MDDRAAAATTSQAVELIPGLKERTPGMLETTIIGALAGGWTARQLASAIAEAPAFNAARAKTIADNETTQAEREGLNAAMRGTNVAQGKHWMTMEDDAVEEDCEENADA